MLNPARGPALKQAPKQILIAMIRLWQLTRYVRPPVCRFYPSCSSYGIQALQRYGTLKGSWLTAKRICRCHPFHPGGYDPLD